MDLAMVKGFDEMSLEEMREIDGGAIPAVIPLIIKGAKAVYKTPIGKNVIDTAVTTFTAWAVGKIVGLIE